MPQTAAPKIGLSFVIVIVCYEFHIAHSRDVSPHRLGVTEAPPTSLARSLAPRKDNYHCLCVIGVTLFQSRQFYVITSCVISIDSAAPRFY